eukprot:1274328-Prymnesium_polylepis.1
MTFLIDSHDGATQLAMREALSKAGTSSRVVIEGAFNDWLKLQHVAGQVRRLPKSGYLIQPDIDDFFGFPDDMQARLADSKHGQVFCATMVDRMASSGMVTELKAVPSLEEQYPLPCWVRQGLSRARLCASTASQPFEKIVLVQVPEALAL